MRAEAIVDIKKRSIQMFEVAMKTGKAIHLCPSCENEREIMLDSGAQAYHWQRGKVVYVCFKCVMKEVQ